MKTRPLARQLAKIDSVIIRMVMRPFSAAISIEPSTPTAPLSVGVAQPAKIEPSTITSKAVIGNRPRHSACQNAARVCGPKSGGNFGAMPGFRIATAMMYTV
jgi:hypothetical protein